MSRFLQAAIVVTSIALGASLAQAQGSTVAMAGQYSEANGIIVNIPQNPPNVPCTQAGNARCVGRNSWRPTTTVTGPGPIILNGPQVGNRAARNIPNGSLSVGGAFTIPPLAFTQMLGVQAGQVLESVVRQLDTTFTAAAPGPDPRRKNNGLTRDQVGYVAPPQTNAFAVRTGFSPANLTAFGQNNGLATTDTGYVYRQGLTTNVVDTFGTAMVDLEYRNGGFNGTMGVLLNGTGRLLLAGAFEPLFPPTFHPIVATNPVGADLTFFRTRNAVGWGYTVTGTQAQGRFKGFPSAPSIVGVPCAATPPPTPVGCNFIQTPGGATFNDVGITLALFGGATSQKFMFPFTTGTVSIVQSGVEQGATIINTLTGMGYDTVTTGGQRNLGLVAGSYVKRLDSQPAQFINIQMVGASLKFTPEPGATVALISGLGLLGALAARRRRS